MSKTSHQSRHTVEAPIFVCEWSEHTVGVWHVGPCANCSLTMSYLARGRHVEFQKISVWRASSTSVCVLCLSFKRATCQMKHFLESLECTSASKSGTRDSSRETGTQPHKNEEVNLDLSIMAGLVPLVGTRWHVTGGNVVSALIKFRPKSYLNPKPTGHCVRR